MLSFRLYFVLITLLLLTACGGGGGTISDEGGGSTTEVITISLALSADRDSLLQDLRPGGENLSFAAFVQV